MYVGRNGAMTQEISTSEQAKNSPPAKPQERVPLFNSIFADVAGMLLTAASSVGAAVLMIDKNFFRNAEKEKRFEKFHKIRDSQRAEPATTSLKGHDWLVRIREIEAQHERAISGELREMGVKGPIEKFRSLRSHQKTEVIFTTAAVTAGAIGLVSSIIGNRITAQKERELADKLDAISDHANNAHGIIS